MTRMSSTSGPRRGVPSVRRRGGRRDAASAGCGAPAGGASASGRGSRIRAGTPTASLPAGTSFVTTAPAPVFASSPIVTGARSIVSTPRKTRRPIVVRCFCRPSKLAVIVPAPTFVSVAEIRVAEIAHVVLPYAAPEPGVLQLGEVADTGLGPDVRAGPEVAERPDLRAVLDDRRLDDRRPDDAARADRAVDDLRAGAERRPRADRCRAAEDHVRLEDDVLGDRHGRVERRRSTGRASSPRPACGRALIRVRRSHSAWASSARSLMPISRPSSSTVRATTTRPSARASSISSVRYSSPVFGRGAQRPDPRPEPGRVERVQAGVDLVDRELLVGRVLDLDDAIHGARLVADHPAEGARLDRVDGDDRDGRLVEAPLLEELAEQRRIEQRRIADEDDDLVDVLGQRPRWRPRPRRRCRGARPGARSRRCRRARRGRWRSRDS